MGAYIINKVWTRTNEIKYILTHRHYMFVTLREFKINLWPSLIEKNKMCQLFIVRHE